MAAIEQKRTPEDLSKCVFSGDSGRAFEVNGIRGHAVTGPSENPHGGVALMSVNGSHGAVMDRVSYRTYVVKEGTGFFTIGGIDREVREDDVIIVPPNTKYDFRGTMKLVAFFTPPFNPDNEVAFK